MKELAARIVVNVLALVFLSALLLGPVVLSQTIVTFDAGENLAVKINDYSFGKFLNIQTQEQEQKVQEFKLKYTAFAQKQGLYRQIVTIKNSGATEQTIKISYQKNSGVSLYFETEGGLGGPEVKTLMPQEQAAVTLLASESSSTEDETKEAAFRLEAE